MSSCHSDGFEVNSDEEEMEPGDPTNLNSPFLAMPIIFSATHRLSGEPFHTASCET